MKIVVHDYSGHPFQVHLSRQLAKRGHDVTHMYNADNHGPKGMFAPNANDSARLKFSGISPGKVKQTNFMGRFVNDRVYGQKAARAIHAIKPDVVLCGNTPVESQRSIMKVCRENDTRFVYWVQDVYGVAMVKLLSRKLGFPGKIAGRYFQRVDHQQFKQSDAIIVISEGFLPEVAPWSKNVTVIENWASTDEITTGDKNNSWSRTHGLDDKFVYLYSGTLGRKHNSEFLLKLATLCNPNQSVAIVGQGVGKDQLAAKPGLPDTLKLLPLQPVESLPHVLATADVLVATIEADAGQFAVPSKIQSYLCSGRPILLSAPEHNAAAQNVIRAKAGIVVPPSDEEGFLKNAKLLFENAGFREHLGANGRAYAEKIFNIDHITDRFESVLVGL